MSLPDLFAASALSLAVTTHVWLVISQRRLERLEAMLLSGKPLTVPRRSLPSPGPPERMPTEPPPQ